MKYVFKTTSIGQIPSSKHFEKYILYFLERNKKIYFLPARYEHILPKIQLAREDQILYPYVAETTLHAPGSAWFMVAEVAACVPMLPMLEM